MCYSQFADIFHQTYLGIHDTYEQNSKGYPMFSGLGNSMPPSAILSDVTGSRKFKMVAVKPKELISQLLDMIGTPFQRLTPFSGSRRSMALLRIVSDVTGSRIFQNGCLQTGSTYISACRQDSNVVPTAAPIFGV